MHWLHWLHCRHCMQHAWGFLTMKGTNMGTKHIDLNRVSQITSNISSPPMQRIKQLISLYFMAGGELQSTDIARLMLAIEMIANQELTR